MQTNRTAHFDKELANKKTMYAFVRFCVKKNGTSRQKLACCLLPVFSLLGALHLFSTRLLNETLIKWFCPTDSHDFENMCFQFSKTVSLTQLGESLKGRRDVIIHSESPKSYVQYLYPEHQVIAPELIIDKTGNIIGLGYAKKKENNTQNNKAEIQKRMVIAKLSRSGNAISN